MSRQPDPKVDWAIYALTDPRDAMVRYVGISKHVYKRYYQHIHDANTGSPKGRWILELLAEELLPSLSILGKAESELEARGEEKYWVEHFSKGAYLTNWNLNVKNQDNGTRIDDPDLSAFIEAELMEGREP